MRFIMMVRASKDCEAGKMPSEERLAAMAKYNEELVRAGVLVDLAGLHPSSKGARVRFSGGKQTVTDGPFAETRELIGGFWIIRVNSMQEAIEWARRAPAPGANGEGEIEIRQIRGLEDFAPSPAIEQQRAVGAQ